MPLLAPGLPLACPTRSEELSVPVLIGSLITPVLFHCPDLGILKQEFKLFHQLCKPAYKDGSGFIALGQPDAE